jgi:hypothetical protein
MTKPLQPVKSLAPVKKRAVTRNQYAQLNQYPSPLSPLRSNSLSVGARRNAPGAALKVEEADGGGRIITLVVLLHRDASAYHTLAARWGTGAWPKMECAKRRRVEDELRWLGMDEMVDEVEGVKQRSMVLRGGGGYV